MKERLALFFDGANHTEALSNAGVSMDYAKFVENLGRTYTIVAARYYTGISDSDKHKGTRGFIRSIAGKSGYIVVTKPVKTFSDGSTKANVDIEIAVDMMTMAHKLDRVMLFSGDGDFRYLVDTMQRMGIYVTVVSTKDFAASELRDQANEFLELKDLMKTHNW